MVLKHKHEFTLLWTHFGESGPQDVHYHPCTLESKDGKECDRVLMGAGRQCDRDMKSHWRATLHAETEE